MEENLKPKKIRVYWELSGFFDFSPTKEWVDFDEIGRRTEVERMFNYKIKSEGITQLPEMSYQEVY